MAKTTKQAIDDHAPWKPASYTPQVAAAIQALVNGTANKGQQIMAMKWIVEECCKTYDMSYRPNSERDTVLAEGKRHVGNQIVALTKVKIGKLQEVKKEA